MTELATSIERQQWLEKSVTAQRKLFKSKDYVVPDTVRVSVGFPRGSHGKGRAIGQCWSHEVSSDQHNEIFISPELGTKKGSVKILGVLAHELTHATVGIKAGHKAPFKRCALAVGLTGQMTATEEGPEFKEWATWHIERIGPYPAGTITLGMRKTQSTRLVKCECAECGYIARVTRKWIGTAGAPVCPTDNVMLSCEEIEQ
jgi:hypothetical protein